MQDRRRLVPLNETAEFQVAPQAPDVRGWPAVLPDGTSVGTVTDLIVDRAVGRVRYVEVALSDAPDGAERHVLVPIGTAQMDSTRDLVIVPAATLITVADRMQYERGAVTRQYEATIRRQVLGMDPEAAERAAVRADERDADAARDAAEAHEREVDEAYYANEHYDERRFLAGRRKGDAGNRDDDFSYLVGVGGAMTDRDSHPEMVTDLGAGQIRIPLMEEETRRAVAPEERGGPSTHLPGQPPTGA